MPLKVLHLICQQTWKTQCWPQDWEWSIFIPIPKKDNAKECSNYCTTALILHASKVMIKVLLARPQQYMNWEILNVLPGFRKGIRTTDQIDNIRWIIEKAREFQKNICFTDYTNIFDCVHHNKLWTILKEMGIPDHITFLRNLYMDQEATVRIRYGTTDWFKIGKGVSQGCILLSCLFNLYTEHIRELLGWISYKLESRQVGEISQHQICGWYHSKGRKQRGTKEPLDEGKGGE